MAFAGRNPERAVTEELSWEFPKRAVTLLGRESLEHPVQRSEDVDVKTACNLLKRGRALCVCSYIRTNLNLCDPVFILNMLSNSLSIFLLSTAHFALS